MSHTPSAPPALEEKSRVGPSIMFAVGGLLMALAVAALVMGLDSASARISRSLDRGAALTPAGPTSVALKKDLTYGLYSDDADATCSGTGPGGDAISVQAPRRRTTTRGLTLVGTFQADDAGTYTVTCTSGPQARLQLARHITVGQVSSAVWGVLASIVLGLPGLGLLGSGGIWMIVCSTHNRKVHEQMALRLQYRIQQGGIGSHQQN